MWVSVVWMASVLNLSGKAALLFVVVALSTLVDLRIVPLILVESESFRRPKVE